MPRTSSWGSKSRLGRLQQTLQRYVEARLNVGVVTMLDPADIPAGALSRGKNINVRFDRTSRRDGTILLIPPKPDNDPVLGLFYFKLKNGAAFTFRVTENKLHFRTSDILWTEITGAGLNGTAIDRFQFVNILNTVIFANNGADPIQALDLVGGTYATLGNVDTPNTGKYRYITGFFNRVVAAALRGVNEVEVAWSADGDPTEWDPAVNETAGSSPILESPSDLSDFITGIYGFTTTAIMLRERSIWLVTKKPSPTDPFNFYSVYPGIGCDAPNSVAVIPNGLCWLDTRTGTVWAFTPDSAPEPIGRAVEKNILQGLDDPNQCFGSYAGKPNEYTIGIPRAASNVTTTWTYNFRTKAWAEGEYHNICSIDDIELSFASLISSLMIDDLVGMINDLPGVIDDLISFNTSVSVANVRAFGKTDGDILIESSDADTDAGTTYETLIDSKVFQVPTDNESIHELRIEFVPRQVGSIEILWSDNGGVTFSPWRTINQLELPVDRSTIVKTFGPLDARQYVWRVRATDGAFEILSFEIIVARGGDSRL